MPAHISDDAVNALGTEKKDTNPKDAVGTGKVPFSTIPSEVVAELGLVMLLGARKYGRHNYRAAGVRASVYHDAALRHLMRWFEGEELDAESGISHLVHAMACCCVLRDSQFYGNLTDDRPPKLPDGWLEELNAKAKEIVERYPDPAEPYTQIQFSEAEIEQVRKDTERAFADHPKEVMALNEEWMRDYEWTTYTGQYVWRDAERGDPAGWRVLLDGEHEWFYSTENEKPGQNGPFSREK